MKFSALLIFLMSFQVFSQNWIDIASISLKSSPYNKLDNSKDQINFSSTSINLKIPVVIKNDNAIILGIEHQANSISSNQDRFTPLYFQSSMLQMGYLQNWNKKHKSLFMTMTRLNSGYQNVNSEQLQIAGLFLSTSKRSQNFNWKYGMYFNTEFSGSMFVPLFGFNWKINDHWRLKTVLPINLELSYQHQKGLRSGLFFEGINASYRISNKHGVSNEYIDKADNNINLFSEINLGKKIWLHGKIGHSILRKYKVYSNNEKIKSKIGPINIGDNRPETLPLFNNGLSFEIRMLYRIPT
ncbi:MAG: DUF6268 family outer membrane beta-barrel protein [Crocinitomicaceae bacterium]|nr:DUF6268 family outer membrane beta-barrel protein [Crocinitomicaceae bacterium]